MAGIRLILFYRFATADPLFLLLLQKKKWQKENEPGGISISLRTSLNRPRKPLRFSWIFPARTGRFAPKSAFPYGPVPPVRGKCPEGTKGVGTGGAKRRMRAGEHYRYCNANLWSSMSLISHSLRRASFPQGKPNFSRCEYVQICNF